jgi:hypothetical protein
MTCIVSYAASPQQSKDVVFVDVARTRYALSVDRCLLCLLNSSRSSHRSSQIFGVAIVQLKPGYVSHSHVVPT